MSVLPGEGTYPILYGTTTLAARSQIHTGYLARPDLGGSFPAIVVVPPAQGITSGLKDLCRRIARQGLAAVAYDSYRGTGPGRDSTPEEVEAAYAELRDSRVLADLEDVYRFLRGPGTEWADPDRLGLFGIGCGGRLAAVSAVQHPYIGAVAVAYAPLIDDPGRSHQSAEILGELAAPLLGLHGKADDVVAVDQATAVRGLNPAAELVLYEDGHHDFLDDNHGSYDDAITADAVDRIVGFFFRHLGTVTVASSPQSVEEN